MRRCEGSLLRFLFGSSFLSHAGASIQRAFPESLLCGAGGAGDITVPPAGLGWVRGIVQHQRAESARFSCL